MNVLRLEGAKNDVCVNVLAPTARSDMTEGLLSPLTAELTTPESVTPGVLFLVSDDAPRGVILNPTAGAFAVNAYRQTPGVHLDESERVPETIAARFAEISAQSAEPLKDAFAQTYKFVTAAVKSEGDRGGVGIRRAASQTLEAPYAFATFFLRFASVRRRSALSLMKPPASWWS